MKADQSRNGRDARPYALFSGRCMPYLALAVMCLGLVAPAQAKEKPADVPRVEKLDDAALNKLLELAKPTAQDQLLSSLVGTWDYTATFRMTEDAEPQASLGAMTNEMAVGGRYLSSKTSLLLNVGGQNIPYEALGLLGYDTAKKLFTSVWADTMHSGVITGTGKYDEKSKTIEEKGHFTLPLSGKEQAYRAELQWTGADAYKRTIFMTGKSGHEFKVLEIEFHRRK